MSRAATAYALRLVDPHPLLAPLGLQAGVGPGREVRRLALHLAVAVDPTLGQLSVLDREAHRAAGLRLVAAVGEPAADRELLQVGERAQEPLVAVPQLDRAQAG